MDLSELNLFNILCCLWCYSGCVSTPGRLKSLPDHRGNIISTMITTTSITTDHHRSSSPYHYNEYYHINITTTTLSESGPYSKRGPHSLFVFILSVYLFIYFIYLALPTRAGSPQQHMPSTVGPFCLTHPVNFPCGRKPEYPEETHDFRQSVDFYSFHMRTGFESH